VPVNILVNTALPRRASKEALRRETIMPWFNDFHRSGANPGFMGVSTEPKNTQSTVKIVKNERSDALLHVNHLFDVYFVPV
jgi:hypothetical protein